MCPWSDNMTGIDALNDMYMHQGIEGVPEAPDMEYWAIRETGDIVDPKSVIDSDNLDNLPKEGIDYWVDKKIEVAYTSLLLPAFCPVLLIVPVFMFMVYVPIIKAIGYYNYVKGEPKYEVRKYEAED